MVVSPRCLERGRNPSTPSHHPCEGRPPALQASRAQRAIDSAVASAACVEGRPGPLPHLQRACSSTSCVNLGRRPRERADPYAVPYRFGRGGQRPFVSTNVGGYGSLLSQGRRRRIQLSNSRNDFAIPRRDAPESLMNLSPP